MLLKTEGIVLKTIKYSETSVISKIFTREYGECSFIIYGVRGSRNKSKGNLFQPLQILELDIYYHPNKSILKLKEYRSAVIYSSLYHEIIKQSVAVFTLEILSKCIQEREVNIPLYDYFREYLLGIDSGHHYDSISPQVFLKNISDILGFRPFVNTRYESNSFFNLEEGILQKEQNHLQVLLNQSDTALFYKFMTSEKHLFSKSERLKILDILLTYFKIHIPGFKEVTSLEILRMVLK